jgi:hypothetical protein
MMRFPALALAGLMLSAPLSWAVDPRPALEPDPQLRPQDVVHLQMTALANKDDPYADAGIELAYRFASPANKTATGPLDRFIQLLKTPIYEPMLHHLEVEYMAADVMGSYAEQRVIVTTVDGRRAGYLFSLSRQGEGGYRDCWMTDSVVPFPVGGDPADAAF